MEINRHDSKGSGNVSSEIGRPSGRWTTTSRIPRCLSRRSDNLQRQQSRKSRRPEFSVCFRHGNSNLLPSRIQLKLFPRSPKRNGVLSQYLCSLLCSKLINFNLSFSPALPTPATSDSGQKQKWKFLIPFFRSR